MPCQCDYMIGSSYDKYEEIIDELGQYLCFLCGELEHDKILSKYADKALLKWWKEHQKEDTKRVSTKIRKAYKKQTAKQIADKLILEAKKVHSVSRFHIEWFHDLARKIYAEKAAKQKEKAQQVAIAKEARKKLSPVERNALGIK